MRQSRALREGRVLSHFSLFSVVAVYYLLLCVPEMISFTVLFPVVIAKGDCQLVYGMERSGFFLFPVCYLEIPDRNDGIELYHSSSTVLHTA